MEDFMKEPLDASVKMRQTDTSEPNPPNDQTFTVRALRKKGTDKWYAITYTALDDGSYPFITRRLPDLWHPDFLKDGIGFVAESNLPKDAELVELECRVTKIIEP